MLSQFLLEIVAERILAHSEPANEVNSLRVQFTVVSEFSIGYCSVQSSIHLVCNCLRIEKGFFEHFQSVFKNLRDVLRSNVLSIIHREEDFEEKYPFLGHGSSEPENKISYDLPNIQSSISIRVSYQEQVS